MVSSKSGEETRETLMNSWHVLRFCLLSMCLQVTCYRNVAKLRLNKNPKFTLELTKSGLSDLRDALEVTSTCLDLGWPWLSMAPLRCKAINACLACFLWTKETALFLRLWELLAAIGSLSYLDDRHSNALEWWKPWRPSDTIRAKLANFEVKTTLKNWNLKNVYIYNIYIFSWYLVVANISWLCCFFLWMIKLYWIK